MPVITPVGWGAASSADVGCRPDGYGFAVFAVRRYTWRVFARAQAWVCEAKRFIVISARSVLRILQIIQYLRHAQLADVAKAYPAFSHFIIIIDVAQRIQRSRRLTHFSGACATFAVAVICPLSPARFYPAQANRQSCPAGRVYPRAERSFALFSVSSWFCTSALRAGRHPFAPGQMPETDRTVQDNSDANCNKTKCCERRRAFAT